MWDARRCAKAPISTDLRCSKMGRISAPNGRPGKKERRRAVRDWGRWEGGVGRPGERLVMVAIKRMTNQA